MAWYDVLVLVLGIVGSFFGIFGISAYINERMKHKADKKNKKEDDDEQKAKEEAQRIKDMEEKQLLEKFRAIVREENAPLSAKLESVEGKIETLENSLKLNTEGTVTILRSDMNRIKTELEERGYATDSEKGNWKQLYTTYGDLGGNHFKEYVDEWKTSIEKLPPAKKIRKNKSKTIITESSN